MSQYKQQLEYQVKVSDWFKRNYPKEIHEGLSEEDIYNTVRVKDPSMPEYQPFNPVRSTQESMYSKPTDSPDDYDTSPSYLKDLVSTFSGLSVATFSDSDFAKKAFNNSSAGLLHQAMYGKPKYDVDMTAETGMIEQAGQFLVGMINPVDIGLLFTGNIVGKAAATKLLGKKSVDKYMRTQALENVAARVKAKSAGKGALAHQLAKAGKFSGETIATAGVTEGISLGTYGAAGGALGSLAQQSTRMRNGEQDEFDYWSVASEAAKAGSSGLIAGALSGGAVQGTMGQWYTKSKLKNLTSESAKFKDLAVQYATNPASQVAVEAGVFSAIDLPLMGEELNWENYKKNAIQNFFVIGGIRSLGYGYKKKSSDGKPKDDLTTNDDADGIQSILKETSEGSKKNLQSRESQRADKAAKTVSDKIQEEGLITNKQVLDELLAGNLDDSKKSEGLTAIYNNFVRLNELTSQIDVPKRKLEIFKKEAEGKKLDKQDVKDLEIISEVAELTPLVLNATNKTFSDMILDARVVKGKDGKPDVYTGELFNHIEAYRDRALTTPEKKDIYDNVNRLNTILTEDLDKMNDLKRIYDVNKKDFEADKVSEKAKKPELKIGDTAQWSPKGVMQFKEGKRITKIIKDKDRGDFVFLEGEKTGFPLKEVSKFDDIKPEENVIIDNARTVADIKGSPEQIYDNVFSQYNALLDDLGIKRNARKKILKDIVKLSPGAGSDFTFLKTKLTEPGYADKLVQVSNTLSNIKNVDKVKLKSKANTIDWFQSYVDAENIRKKPEVNIKEEPRAKILKSLGVETGNVFDASDVQIKQYQSFMKSLDPVNTNEKTRIADKYTLKNEVGENKSMFRQFIGSFVGDEKAGQIIEGAKMTSLPVFEVVRKYSKKLSNTLINRTASEQGHIGFVNNAIYNIRKEIGKKKFKSFSSKVRFIDPEVIKDPSIPIEVRNEGQRFINKAYKNPAEVDPKKRIVNLETDEGKFVQAVNDMYDYSRKELTDIVYKISDSEASAEAWIKDNFIEFQEPGTYVNRILTKEARDLLDLNHKKIQKVIDEKAEALATKMAKDKYGNPTNKQIGEFKEKAEYQVKSQIETQSYYGTPQAFNRSLLNRSIKFPEYLEGPDGTKIKTYESDFDVLMGKYSTGMAKYLATLEHFPEFAKLPGLSTGAQYDAFIQKIKQNNQISGKMSKYIDTALKRDLGLEVVPEQGVSARAIAAGTAITAKLGLSGLMMPGLKNVLMGTTMNMATYRMRDFLKAITQSISRDNKEIVRKTNALDIGTRIYDEGLTGVVKSVSDVAFWFGAMKPSENFNRYSSVLISMVEQERLVKHLSLDPSTKQYKKAVNRLEKFYEVSDSEMAMLKEYGLNAASDVDFATKKQKIEVERSLKTLYQKMNSMAHIKTQGSAMDLFMPLWAGNENTKPALLYKRMAYAATANAISNTKLAIENGELLRPAMYMLGSYMTAEALMGVYSGLLGTPKPEAQDWDNRLKTLAYKGEFLGIASSFANPYGVSFTEFVMPVQLDNAASIGKLLLDYNNNTRTGYQTFDEMARTTTGLYRNLQKVANQGLASNRMIMNDKRFNQLERTYRKAKDVYIGAGGDYARTEKDLYRDMLLPAFVKGNKDAFAKAYLTSLMGYATYYYHDSVEQGRVTTEAEAFKKAEKGLERVLKSLNPAQFLIEKNYRTLSDGKVRRAVDKISWLKQAEPDNWKNIIKDMKEGEKKWKEMYDSYMPHTYQYIRKNFKRLYQDHFKK